MTPLDLTKPADQARFREQWEAVRQEVLDGTEDGDPRLYSTSLAVARQLVLAGEDPSVQLGIQIGTTLSLLGRSLVEVEKGKSPSFNRSEALAALLAYEALVRLEGEKVLGDVSAEDKTGVPFYSTEAIARALARQEGVPAQTYQLGRLWEAYAQLRALEERNFIPPPMAVRLQEGAAVRKDDEKTRVRAMVQEMADKWGTDKTVVHQALEEFSRRVGKGPEDLPGHSRLTSIQMGFWFGFSIADLLAQIVKGKVKGDIRLEDFNRLLPVISSYIMRASGWSPHIDQSSLEAITRAIVCSRSENRPLIITSTHESWTDITAIAGLFRGLPSRFVYKKELELVPGLGFVLVFGDMTPVVRPPSEEGDPAKVAAARKKAKADVAKVKDKVTQKGIVSIDFTPGTRVRAGAGVGEAKKGFANLALDLNAVVLVLNVEGTSQIMPVSWGKYLLTQGAGTNRRVDVKVTDIYPEDYKPAEGLSGVDERKAHVQAIRDAAEAIQIRNGIAIINDWQEAVS
ncbi:MAG: 1-acyl-sn-glycerol-3-phosphate acyltransferase, partial [Deltaproteobacteria bacterium]|nr:1-acyl-sn-glycerol-3-phosphate acyltransferase [Deltaproteobacteria bacterium]